MLVYRLEKRNPQTLLAQEIDEIHLLHNLFLVRSRAMIQEAICRQDFIILIRHRNGVLKGTVGLQFLCENHRNKPVYLISTNLVVLDHELRGTTILHRIGLHVWLWLRLRHPLRSIYWLTAAYNIPSFMLLARNFKTFWPNPLMETPEPEKDLLSRAGKRVAEGYPFDPEKSVIFYPTRLKAKVESEKSGNNTFVRFFYERLPPHDDKGGTLLCLCPLNIINGSNAVFHALGKLFFRRKKRRG